MDIKREKGLYGLMACLPVRIGYAGKVFLGAFLPAQIPILTFALLVHFNANHAQKVGGLAVSMTLGGLLMAYGIYSVLRPMRTARRRIRQFADERQVGNAPETAMDGAGFLLADIDRVCRYASESIERLERMSSMDFLTGIPNRRFCGPRLEQDLARSRRDGVPITLAFMDLDRLKTVNDEFGHLAGDQCLRHMAHAVGRSVREGDWYARWGGDEFVLGLWNTDRHQAEIVCDRILRYLRDHPAPFEGHKIPLSASVGICEAYKDADADELLSKADKALMTAKRAGRDQLVLFDPMTPGAS